MGRSRGCYNDDFIERRFTSEAQHNRLVVDVCDKMKQYDRTGRSHRGDSRVPYNAPSDVLGLDKIVKIDLIAMTARVEANMTMDALVQAMLPLGYLPAVVASSRSMTAADAFAALTSESSSFAFGTFDCTVTEIEVVLGNGQLVHAQPGDALTEGLFYGSAGALNSLGLITVLEVCLVRAGPYVELKFQPVIKASGPEIDLSKLAVCDIDAGKVSRSDEIDASSGDVINALKTAQKVQSNTFIEAVLFRQSSGVVITGSFSPDAASRTLQKGRDLLQLADSVWCTRTCVRRSMRTESYLFRNMEHETLPKTCKDQPSFFCKEKVEAPRRFKNYGVPEAWATSFLQMIDAAPAWIRVVFQPRDAGRRNALGIGCAFDYDISLCATEVFFQDVADRFLLDDCKNSRRGPRGFSYLQCRAPCPLGRPWIFHNDRWYVEPWMFHDDRWYLELRSKWHSQSLADISDRIAQTNPLRFAYCA